jgi:predicted permease
MHGFLTDLRLALRWVLVNRGVTALALVTIALGIGPNTAVFSVVNGVVLRPLPFTEPEQLASLWSSSPEAAVERLTGADLEDLGARCRSFSSIGIYWISSEPVGLGKQVEEQPILSIYAGLQRTLGMEPLLGRLLTRADEQEDAEPVVVIGHGLWQRWFGGDPDVLGRTLMVRGGERTIVGVLPDRPILLPAIGKSPQAIQVWTPWYSWHSLNTSRKFKVFHAIARLRDGTTPARAMAEVRAVADQLSAENPVTNRGRSFLVVPLKQELLGQLGTGLMLMLAAVAIVLLIACINVANLQLALGVRRRREIATRLALGASRWQIGRRMMLESLLLGLAGGALGLVLARWAVPTLIAVAPAGVPRLDEVTIDGRVLLFSAAVILLTSLVLGVIPVLQHLRTPLRAALAERGRGATLGRGGRRVKRLIVVGQIALSVVLLVTAALLIKSFNRLLAVDPGFDSEQILAVSLRVPGSIPDDGLFSHQLEESLSALPDVVAAGTIGFLPFAHPAPETRYQTTSPALKTLDESRYTYVNSVSPGYFNAMGIPLIQGRSLTWDDFGERRIVVSSTLAAQGWPDESPLGQVLTMDTAGDPWQLEVVGVVGDVHLSSLEAPPEPVMYRAQSRRGNFSLYTVVRAKGDPARQAAAVRRVIQDIDPSITILRIDAMRELVLQSVARQRLVAWLLAIAAVLALVLALVGTYGVMSSDTARRSQEIGIRLALGAAPGGIARLVLGHGLRLAGTGVAIGVLVALAVTRLLGSLLFETSQSDPVSFAGAALLLLLAALAACTAPALRAARINPLSELHDE